MARFVYAECSAAKCRGGTVVLHPSEVPAEVKPLHDRRVHVVI